MSDDKKAKQIKEETEMLQLLDEITSGKKSQNVLQKKKHKNISLFSALMFPKPNRNKQKKKENYFEKWLLSYGAKNTILNL